MRRHKAVLVLGCLLLALGVAACGDSSSSNLHTEASIEARTHEIQAEVVAIEATAQAILSLEPTPIIPTATPAPETVSVAGTYSTIQPLERLKSSVVWINVEMPGDEYGSGTGIVFSESGLTLTNHHVVAGATNISAVVTDVTGARWTVNATFLVGDVYADLAVIQLDSLPVLAQVSWPARLGSIRDIKLGDEVVALGYSAQPGLAVTNGTVTSIKNDGIRDVIQHDALIGQGDSGGPLVNSDGSVVGVNTYSSRSSQDKNFEDRSVAIAIEAVIQWIEQLEIQDSVTRPADVFYLRGNTFSYLEQYESAMEEYDHAIRLDPNFALAYVDRGTVSLTLGHHEQSIEDLDEAIRLDPRLAKAYTTRGRAYYNHGEYERAIQDYDEAIRLEPRYADAYYNRGLAYRHLGEYWRAIWDYDEAIHLNPLGADAYHSRGIAYWYLGQYERAIQDYDEAIRLNPLDADAYNNRGLAYANLGLFKRAIQDYDEAIRLDPQYAIAYLNRGALSYDLGQYDRAIQDYDAAIRIDPLDADAYYNRGSAYHDLGQYERAIQDYDEAIRLNPLDADASYNRGIAYSHLGQSEQPEQYEQYEGDIQIYDEAP